MALGLGALLVPTVATAADPETQPYDTSYEGNVVNYSYDSDWVPAMSPLQIRLQAGFLDEVSASMEGDAVYDWDNDTLVFNGTPNTGSFLYEIGVELTTSVRLNLGMTQIPADVIGPIDLKLPTGASFMPYLLDGNPDRPADGSTSFTVTALDTDLNFGSAATGNVKVDVQVDFIGLSFEGIQIDCSESEAGTVLATADVEGELLDYSLTPPEAPMTADIWAQLTGEMSAETSIHLLPSVTVTPNGGSPITIGPFDFDVNFPVVDGELLVFDWEQIPYEGPTEDPTTGDESESSDTGEETSSGETTETTGDESDDSGDESGNEETETSGDDAGIDTADGCDCRSQGSRPGAGALALLALIGLRRRRRV